MNLYNKPKNTIPGTSFQAIKPVKLRNQKQFYQRPPQAINGSIYQANARFSGFFVD